MIALLLILIPLVTGILNFQLPKQTTIGKPLQLAANMVLLGVAIWGLCTTNTALLSTNYNWLPTLGAKFALQLDGLSKMLVLLTAVAGVCIAAATYHNDYKNIAQYLGFSQLALAGLMGVFLSNDCLLFYFFWELALLPAYFLCSIWGGEKRIAVTFKFFLYTFIGSLLLLVGILYVYFHTPDASFAAESMYKAVLTKQEKMGLFWLFFVAFAIKMPIFPFHTWQPDTYEQSPTAVTMLLSGVMVKMGLFAVIKWLLPVFPEAATYFATPIIWVTIGGMIYASFIAINQNDVKRLIAYSSIAHIGLMAAVLFTKKQVGFEGVMIQMFNHGINVIGLWIVADVIEKQLGTRKISELGGLAAHAPKLTLALVVLAFANVSLPLTNAFVGEFLLFNGLFQFNIWVTVLAVTSIILVAVYTLNMVQNVFYGKANEVTVKAVDMPLNVTVVLVAIIASIIALGVYPQPMLTLTADSVKTLMAAF